MVDERPTKGSVNTIANQTIKEGSDAKRRRIICNRCQGETADYKDAVPSSSERIYLRDGRRSSAVNPPFSTIVAPLYSEQYHS